MNLPEQIYMKVSGEWHGASRLTIRSCDACSVRAECNAHRFLRRFCVIDGCRWGIFTRSGTRDVIENFMEVEK